MIDFSTLDKIAEYKNGELQWLEGRDINAIYAILVGDEYYIGSSHYVYLRIGQHLKSLLSDSHHSSKLQEKFRVVHDFDVFVLERGINNKELLHTEEYYIRKYKPTLNIVTPSKSNYMRIREAIEQQGMTTQDVAKKMGITLSGLNQHISGNPSIKVLTKIAEALNVPMWQLFASPEEVQLPSNALSIKCPHCGNKFPVSVNVELKTENR